MRGHCGRLERAQGWRILPELRGSCPFGGTLEGAVRAVRVPYLTARKNPRSLGSGGRLGLGSPCLLVVGGADFALEDEGV